MTWWHHEMTRVIFDYIDEQKGEQSRFITDENGAFEEIRRRLEPKTHDKNVYATINKEKIRNKLMKQTVSGGLSGRTIQDLYINGTSILKLESMQKGVFSDAEIATAKEKGIISTKSSGVTQKRRREDETSSAPKRLRLNLSTATAGERDRSEANKRKVTDNLEDETIRKKRLKITPLAESNDSAGSHTQPINLSSEQMDKRCLYCQAKGLQCDLKPRCSYCRARHKACRYSLKPMGAGESVNQSTHGTGTMLTNNTVTEQLSEPEPDDAQSNFGRNISYNPLMKLTEKDVGAPTKPSGLKPIGQVLFVCEICEQSYQDKNEMIQHKQHVHESNLLGDRFLCRTPDCLATFTRLDDLERHKKIHEELEALRSQLCPNGGTTEEQEGRRWIDLMEMVQPNDKDIHLIRLLQHDQAARHIDVETIRERMQRIQRNIHKHTMDFLDGYDIHTHRDNPDFNLDSYGISLINLLETVFAPGILGNPDLFEETMKCPDNELEVQELVAALIGAAVTLWALQPLPQSNVYNDDLLGEYHSALGKKSKALQSNVLEEATRNYLRRQVKPKLDKFAYTMAVEMLDILRHFIRFDSWNGTRLWPDLARRLRTQEFEDSDEESLPSLSPPPRSPRSLDIMTPYPLEPAEDARHKFLEGLAKDVFEVALNLRIDMEIKGNAKYRFYFPRYGHALDFKHHIVHHKASNKEIQDPELCKKAGTRYDYNAEDQPTPARTILIGLTPRIEGHFKDTRDGPWREEWITICKGRVHLWKPNKERDLASQPRDEEDEEDNEDLLGAVYALT